LPNLANALGGLSQINRGIVFRRHCSRMIQMRNTVVRSGRHRASEFNQAHLELRDWCRRHVTASDGHLQLVGRCDLITPLIMRDGISRANVLGSVRPRGA